MTWPGNPFVRTSPVAAEGSAERAAPEPPVHGAPSALLYLGYTGMAVPFAFGVAALVTTARRGMAADRAALDARARDVPHLGIVAGAWWSYEVLGWGGYWGWDPVENAALLPWLTATAFIHSAMVAERRGGLGSGPSRS
jgi:cytochrome c-type biogenesis protein CcmF